MDTKISDIERGLGEAKSRSIGRMERREGENKERRWNKGGREGYKIEKVE